jgi:hypothetical protein
MVLAGLDGAVDQEAGEVGADDVPEAARVTLA